MTKPQVLVIGRNCVDYISVVDRFPDEDKKTPLSRRMSEGGGQGGTSACCIARLGGKAVLTGVLGDDAEGRFCLDRLVAYGVDITHVRIVKDGHTPVAYIFITQSSGKRTIIYENSTLPNVTFDAKMQALALDSGAVLLSPDVTFLSKSLGMLQPQLPPIIYDAERWRQGIDLMMAIADYFIPTSDFLDVPELQFEGLSFREKIFLLQKRIEGRLVVTAGERGAFFVDGESLCRVPAVGVSVADTIGAGDNFHGAFALAVARGDKFVDAVKFGVAVASLSCRDYGGRKGLPFQSEAEAKAAALSCRMEG
ncbi:MAG: carbohydrate kinase family protein [Desulfobacteraceae bacterium]|jgi:sulfofructose kinase